MRVLHTNFDIKSRFSPIARGGGHSINVLKSLVQRTTSSSRRSAAGPTVRPFYPQIGSSAADHGESSDIRNCRAVRRASRPSDDCPRKAWQPNAMRPLLNPLSMSWNNPAEPNRIGRMGLRKDDSSRSTADFTASPAPSPRAMAHLRVLH